ncbi:MAG: hypothetical protein GY710_11210 [Desulfobacteraceae bacterium]|nr:hypothetical protein [Desulfobacteraceae bacterium]
MSDFSKISSIEIRDSFLNRSTSQEISTSTYAKVQQDKFNSQKLSPQRQIKTDQVSISSYSQKQRNQATAYIRLSAQARLSAIKPNLQRFANMSNLQKQIMQMQSRTDQGYSSLMTTNDTDSALQAAPSHQTQPGNISPPSLDDGSSVLENSLQNEFSAPAVEENIAAPEVPATEEAIIAPEIPTAPEVPATEEVITAPEIPTAPEAPAPEEVTTAPEIPTAPETPATVEVPVAEEVIAAPAEENVVLPGVPAAEEAITAPEIPVAAEPPAAEENIAVPGVPAAEAPVTEEAVAAPGATANSDLAVGEEVEVVPETPAPVNQTISLGRNTIAQGDMTELRDGVQKVENGSITFTSTTGRKITMEGDFTVDTETGRFTTGEGGMVDANNPNRKIAGGETFQIQERGNVSRYARSSNQEAVAADKMEVNGATISGEMTDLGGGVQQVDNGTITFGTQGGRSYTVKGDFTIDTETGRFTAGEGGMVDVNNPGRRIVEGQTFEIRGNERRNSIARSRDQEAVTGPEIAVTPEAVAAPEIPAAPEAPATEEAITTPEILVAAAEEVTTAPEIPAAPETPVAE